MKTKICRCQIRVELISRRLEKVAPTREIFSRKIYITATSFNLKVKSSL